MSGVNTDCHVVLARALRGDFGEATPISLLECFREGRLEIISLLELALAQSDEIAAVGTWIAAELPSHVHAIFEQLLPLSRHSASAVRTHVLDVLSHQAKGDESGTLDAAIVAALDDDDVAVRCKALELLARWPEDRLQRAVEIRVAATPRIDLPNALRSDAALSGESVSPTDEWREVLALIPAVRGRLEFELIATRAARSRYPRIAATARVLLAELDRDPA